MTVHDHSTRSPAEPPGPWLPARAEPSPTPWQPPAGAASGAASGAAARRAKPKAVIAGALVAVAVASAGVTAGVMAAVGDDSTVSAVSATSITVKSEDGFSKTYVVGSATTVDNGAGQISA